MKKRERKNGNKLETQKTDFSFFQVIVVVLNWTKIWNTFNVFISTAFIVFRWYLTTIAIVWALTGTYLQQIGNVMVV